MGKRILKAIFHVTMTVLLIVVVVVVGSRFLVRSPIAESVYDRISNMQVGSPDLVASISGEKYAYHCLSDDAQIVYDQVLHTILEHQTEAVVSTKSSEVLSQAYDSVHADYGGLFWVEGYEYVTYQNGDYVTAMVFRPRYTMTLDERNRYQAQIDAVVADWLYPLSLDASDYEKSKYIFEKLISEVDYVPDSENNQNIISTFLNRQTVCKGYAAAASYLFDQVGIQSTIISGMSDTQRHAWNLIRLNDAYYLFDATWGNSDYRDSAYVNLNTKIINYAYLNATDEDFRDNHMPDMPFELPECNSREDSYYVREDCYVRNLDGTAVAQRIADRFYAGEQVATFRFETDEIYQKMMEYLVTGRHFGEFCPDLKSISYIPNEDMRVLTIIFSSVV